MKRSPAAACWLSLVPGLGHVYLGQTLKGIAIILLAASAMQLADRGADAFGIVIPFIWIGAILDAYRSAQEINYRVETGREPPRSPGSPSLNRYWGWALIAMGVLFLLDNIGIFDMEWIWQLWPVGLIALGIYILRRPAALEAANALAETAGTPPPPPEAPVETDGPESASVESEPTHD